MPTYNQDCKQKRDFKNSQIILYRLFYLFECEPLLEVRKIWRRTFMICDYETSYILLVSQ